MTKIIGYDHLSLSVSDAARSAAWYVEVLGFVEVRRAVGHGFERIILIHPDSNTALGLTCHQSGEGRDEFSEHRVGMDHVAFAAEGHEELAVWRRRFEELGVVHSDIKETPTGSLVTFRDPDNIQLEIRARGESP